MQAGPIEHCSPNLYGKVKGYLQVWPRAKEEARCRNSYYSAFAAAAAARASFIGLAFRLLRQRFTEEMPEACPPTMLRRYRRRTMFARVRGARCEL
jgi:hypothetical protein